ncbi:oxidoreductase [Acidothermaceae bacterium B102]|nr:oxidoreductase [Acidothermaceae bacterium B102]
MPSPVSRAVLVTGCSSGIGAASARQLLTAGWTVWATARDVSTLADLEAAGARVLSLDVTDEGSRRDAVAAVVAEHGAVGALVNNAGYGQYGPVEEVPLERWRAQFETNLFGVVGLTQLVLPGMRAQRWGRVVNVSSMGGRFALPGGGAYHASKFALEGMSDALRLEVRPFGVRVSLVEPGPVSTPWARTAIDTSLQASAEEMEGPYGRFRTELAANLTGAYRESRMSLAASPEQVGRVVARAVASRRPRARYVVGAAGRAMVTLRRLTPDLVFDTVLANGFPVPRP